MTQRSPSSPRKDHGFTFFELILALAIAMVMLAIAYQSLVSMMQGKVVLDDQRETRAIANSVIDRISRELQLAYAGASLLPPCDGTSGQTIGKNTVLIGESSELVSGEPGDSIQFMALEGGQYVPDGQGHGGLVQISYRVAIDPEREKTGGTGYLLVRQELPNIRPVERACEQRMVFPITTAITSLMFEYYDLNADAWVRNWGKDGKSKLPAMVKFTISIRSPRGKVETYTTAVALRASATDVF